MTVFATEADVSAAAVAASTSGGRATSLDNPTEPQQCARAAPVPAAVSSERSLQRQGGVVGDRDAQEGQRGESQRMHGGQLQDQEQGLQQQHSDDSALACTAESIRTIKLPTTHPQFRIIIPTAKWDVACCCLV